MSLSRFPKPWRTSMQVLAVTALLLTYNNCQGFDSLQRSPSSEQSSSDHEILSEFETITIQNTSINQETQVKGRTTGLFPKGSLGPGFVPELRSLEDQRVIPIQLDERAYWSDGSLKFAVVHFNDPEPLAAGQERSYQFFRVAGQYDDNGSPLSSVTDADYELVFTHVQRHDNTTSTSEEDMKASLQKALKTPTRVSRIASGPIVDGWMAWQMAEQSGAEHDHLKIYWYIWQWATGEVEVTATVSQDWYIYEGAHGKNRLSYQAVLNKNGQLVQDYGTIEHHYHGQWLAARMQDDPQHALPHWSSQIPSLHIVREKEYLVATGLIPPFRTNIERENIKMTNTYTVMGAMNHRQAVDAGGDFMGKGLWPFSDVFHFLNQTPDSSRLARVQALAGLSFPRHFRIRDQRQRPGDPKPDIASTPLIYKMDPLPPSEYDFTADGLPQPRHVYVKQGADPGYAYSYPQGGSGGWSFFYPGASHGVAYSMPQYLLTGHRYLLEAAIDHAIGILGSRFGNKHGSRPYPLWDKCQGQETTQWSGVIVGKNQTRDIGWSANIWAVSGFVPEQDALSNYLKKMNAHTGNFLRDFADNGPASWNGAGNPRCASIQAPWMHNYLVQGSLYNHLVTEDTGYESLAQQALRYTQLLATIPPYLYSYRTMAVIPGTLEYVDVPLTRGTAQFDPASNKVTLDGLYGGFHFSENDYIYLLKSGSNNEFDQTRPYYLVNVVNDTAQLALTAGGTPIDFDTAEKMYIGIYVQDYASIQRAAERDTYKPTPLSYIWEGLAVLEYAEYAKLPNSDPALLHKLREFLAEFRDLRQRQDPRAALSSEIELVGQ